MIEGKEAGFARKRKARDKANLRLLKNKAMIVPGILGAALVGALAGGTIALSIGPGLAVYGLALGGGIAAAIGGPVVIRGLSR